MLGEVGLQDDSVQNMVSLAGNETTATYVLTVLSRWNSRASSSLIANRILNPSLKYTKNALGSYVYSP